MQNFIKMSQPSLEPHDLQEFYNIARDRDGGAIDVNYRNKGSSPFN
ncbi:hypothetical protein SAMN05428977_10983 [Nitrosomonas sp. Nm166]|nr:hypothetical protein SAMN05428977_10983 [Nitrosomonas sp. Nm166]